MEVARALAEFAVTMRLEDVPASALAQAKASVLDGVGVALMSIENPATEKVLRYVRSQQAPPKATIWGTECRTTPELAALALGVASHVADFDDVSWTMMGHPTVPLAASLLPLAESLDSSGRDLLSAFTVGFEIEMALGRAVQPSHYESGWHATATLGTLGVAAAASRLLGVDVERCTQAIGIAASFCSGLRRNFGSTVKSLHVGHAAKSGLEAANLAALGMAAAPEVLEGKWGFAETFCGSVDWKAGLESLGRTFSLGGIDLMYKAYPSCTATHQGIDAALALFAVPGVRAEQIRSVECGVAPAVQLALIDRLPVLGLEGKFSLPFCVAVALAAGEVHMGHFSEKWIRHPTVDALMRKTTVSLDPELAGVSPTATSASSTRVCVTLRDGSRHEQLVTEPKGSPRNPMSPVELQRKYSQCAQSRLSATAVRDTALLIDRLETLRSVRELTSVLLLPAEEARAESC